MQLLETVQPYHNTCFNTLQYIPWYPDRVLTKLVWLSMYNSPQEITTFHRPQHQHTQVPDYIFRSILNLRCAAKRKIWLWLSIKSVFYSIIHPFSTIRNPFDNQKHFKHFYEPRWYTWQIAKTTMHWKNRKICVWKYYVPCNYGYEVSIPVNLAMYFFNMVIFTTGSNWFIPTVTVYASNLWYDKRSYARIRNKPLIARFMGPTWGPPVSWGPHVAIRDINRLSQLTYAVIYFSLLPNNVRVWKLYQ